MTRWLTLNRVKAGDSAACTEIVRLLPGEQDWVVQKKMIEVLGASANAASVSVLVPLVRDRARGLDHFAAATLGRLGTPAGRGAY